MHILSLDFQSNVYIVCAKCLHLHWHTKKKKEVMQSQVLVVSLKVFQLLK